ncbi:MAG TPA: RNA-directed DNA polymerase [Spirochaetota bacterium]|nr:RNA-directed DNA polymerase [Spirochaetota bacterium]
MFEKIISYENLVAAAYCASKGKRFRDNVIRFNSNLVENISALRKELSEGAYTHGSYREFYVYDAKKRLISAAPFRDRVVHHALCGVILPVIEKSYIDNTFANREGKGTHRAVKMCQRYARRFTYYVKLDIVKYFSSIDHEILKELLFRKIRCPDTRRLISIIIDGSNPQDSPVYYFSGDTLFTPFERRRGIPLGNLTSQHFANKYLSPLDHFVVEALKIRGYIRYVDDFLLFSDSREYLNRCVRGIVSFLEHFRLRIHENRAHVYPAANGVTFLGYRVFPDYIRLKRDNVIRARRRVRRLYEDFHRGFVPADKLRSSIHSWMGHAANADAWKIRGEVLSGIVKLS